MSPQSKIFGMITQTCLKIDPDIFFLMSPGRSRMWHSIIKPQQLHNRFHLQLDLGWNLEE